MKSAIITFLLLFFALSPVYAQKKVEAKVDVFKQGLLRSVKKSDSFISDHQNYAFVPQLKAVTQRSIRSMGSASYQSAKQILRTSLGSHEVLEEKGPFLVLAMDSKSMRSLKKSEKKRFFPVVLNLSTQQYGIFLNILMLQLKDIASANAIANDYNLTLLKVFPGLKIASFGTEMNSDHLLTQFRSLKLDSRVSSANFDIIEHIKKAL